jgi:hypothetical protein
VADDRPTQPQPRPEPQPPDETARFERPDDDRTAMLPPAGEPAQREPARWAARAGVPVGGPRPAEPEPWVPDQLPRTWWAPILIGLAIIVLIGLIGLGLWVATRSKSGTVPTPSVTPSSAAASASPSPSPTPSPTLSPPPTVALVLVPPLRGIGVSDAQAILQTQGLGSKVVTQVTDQVPPGSVFATDPEAGAQVPAGTTVTLFVATAPPSPSPSVSVSQPTP